jgi:two-component system KDP operon response regulator KdpE
MWDEHPTRILIIDDDARLTEAITRFFEHEGYEVETARDGHQGLERFHRRPADIIVLDVMMPHMDGWEACRRLRESSNVPIIMLTARANESDRVLGLRMGADDYIDKPFSFKELAARIEAVLRRVRVLPTRRNDSVYDDGYLRLARDGMLAIRDGEPVNLTATERRLLFTLADRAGRVLAATQILHHVWGPEYEGQSDYVKLYVWRLRQKLEPDPSNPVYIQTERGLGYRFVPASEHTVPIADRAAAS